MINKNGPVYNYNQPTESIDMSPFKMPIPPQKHGGQFHEGWEGTNPLHRKSKIPEETRPLLPRPRRRSA